MSLLSESGFPSLRGHAHAEFIKSAESSRSCMVKAGAIPIWSAYSRRSRAPIPWNVPAQVSASVITPALSCDTLHAPGHLGRGAARKGHQQDPGGIGPVDYQMGDPVGYGVGLP